MGNTVPTEGRRWTEVLTMRLIDADLLEDQFGVSDADLLALDEIRHAPTVDAVVVTRCKECEHAERYERTDGTVGYYCGHPQNTFAYGERWDRVFKPVKEADDFCSHGERRDKP
nr:MAG TPA: hypothetical protein [Caudoviricetes sp.]